MVLAFAGAVGLVTISFAALGTSERGTVLALQLTARFAFLFFWPAYAGGALAALFGSVAAPLKRYGREFGLAFAAVLIVHLGLVAWLSFLGAAPGRGTFIFFGAAVLWAALLSLFSIRSLQTALGLRWWWFLRTAGLNYILYAFAVDFFNLPLFGSVRHMVAYFPFAALCVAGPIIRFTAFVQRVDLLRRGGVNRI
jgi:hypothetical protein